MFNAASCKRCVCLCSAERVGVVSRGVLLSIRLQWLCKPSSTQERGREGMRVEAVGCVCGGHCYTQPVLTDGRRGRGEGCSISPFLSLPSPFI